MTTIFVQVSALVAAEYAHKVAPPEHQHDFFLNIGRESGTSLQYETNRQCWQLCGDLEGISKAHQIMTTIQQLVGVPNYHCPAHARANAMQLGATENTQTTTVEYKTEHSPVVDDVGTLESVAGSIATENEVPAQPKDEELLKSPVKIEPGVADNEAVKLFTPPKTRSKIGSNQGTQMLNCSDCGRKYHRKSHLLKHMQMKHGAEVPHTNSHKRASEKKAKVLRKLPVEDCGDKLISLVPVPSIPRNQHQSAAQRIKDKYRSRFCYQCQKSFSTYSNLERHLKIIHAGFRYRCFDCSKVFTCRDTLDRHNKVNHHNLRCLKCLHLCQTDRERKRHVCANRRKDRLKCEGCGRMYSGSLSLHKHYRNYHKGVIFSCEFCAAACRSNPELFDHYLHCHNMYRCLECLAIFAAESEFADHKCNTVDPGSIENQVVPGIKMNSECASVDLDSTGNDISLDLSDQLMLEGVLANQQTDGEGSCVITSEDFDHLITPNNIDDVTSPGVVNHVISPLVGEHVITTVTVNKNSASDLQGVELKISEALPQETKSESISKVFSEVSAMNYSPTPTNPVADSTEQKSPICALPENIVFMETNDEMADIVAGNLCSSSDEMMALTANLSTPVVQPPVSDTKQEVMADSTENLVSMSSTAQEMTSPGLPAQECPPPPMSQALQQIEDNITASLVMSQGHMASDGIMRPVALPAGAMFPTGPMMSNQTYMNGSMSNLPGHPTSMMQAVSHGNAMIQDHLMQAQSIQAGMHHGNSGLMSPPPLHPVNPDNMLAQLSHNPTSALNMGMMGQMQSPLMNSVAGMLPLPTSHQDINMMAMPGQNTQGANMLTVPGQSPQSMLAMPGQNTQVTGMLSMPGQNQQGANMMPMLGQIPNSDSTGKINMANLPESPTPLTTVNEETKMKILHKLTKQRTCDVCNKVFSCSGNLSKHIRNIHNNKERLVCEMCPVTFASQQQLTRHVRAVHNDALFNCHCSFQCGSRKELSRHQLETHGVQTSDDCFQCEICGKAFMYEHNLKRHVKKEHDTQSKQELDGQFKQELDGQFKQEHDGQFKPDPIAACNSLYGGVEQSEMSSEHPGKPRVSCELCTKSYKTKQKLREHILSVHTSSMPFSCGKCSKRFNRQSSVSFHWKRCNGMVPGSGSDSAHGSETESETSIMAKHEQAIDENMFGNTVSNLSYPISHTPSYQYSSGFSELSSQPLSSGFSELSSQPLSSGFSELSSRPLSSGFSELSSQPLSQSPMDFDDGGGEDNIYTLTTLTSVSDMHDTKSSMSGGLTPRHDLSLGGLQSSAPSGTHLTLLQSMPPPQKPSPGPSLLHSLDIKMDDPHSIPQPTSLLQSLNEPLPFDTLSPLSGQFNMVQPYPMSAPLGPLLTSLIHDLPPPPLGLSPLTTPLNPLSTPLSPLPAPLNPVTTFQSSVTTPLSPHNPVTTAQDSIAAPLSPLVTPLNPLSTPLSPVSLTVPTQLTNSSPQSHTEPVTSHESPDPTPPPS